MSSSQTSSSSSSEAPAADAEGGLASLGDIRCAVDFTIGTGAISVREFLQLTEQSVVRLAQSVGSDLAVVVHGVTLATGEVVILDHGTALRISRIVPPPGEEAE